MKPDQAEALRKAFPKSAVGRMPKGGVMLEYVGHAATTDRLLTVDPEWSWEPVAFDPRGLPQLDEFGGLWIRLTVCGVTRYGYGDAAGKKGPNAVKEAIGDAIRNAAMRFGVALDLWAKEDISNTTPTTDTPPPVSAGEGAAGGGAPRQKPDGWRIKLYQGLRERFPNDRDAGLRWVSLQIGRAVSSSDDLSSSEVQDVVAIMRGARPEVVEPPEYEPEDAA